VARQTKRLSALAQLERTRLIWGTVLKYSGDLGPHRKVRFARNEKGVEIRAPQLIDVFDKKYRLPKTTKGGRSCFEEAARELGMSEITVRRTFYEELKRRRESGGWTPDENDPA
jgi:hypothetical protein